MEDQVAALKPRVNKTSHHAHEKKKKKKEKDITIHKSQYFIYMFLLLCNINFF